MDITNFEEARENAMALANEEEVAPETAEQAEGTTEQATEAAPQEQQGDSLVENAVATAENAAQIANDQAQQLNALTHELNQQKQVNSQLSEQIRQMSEQHEEAIVEQAIKPPEIDFASLAFADEETQRNATAKYAQDMADYQRETMLKELTPLINEAKRGAELREKQQLFNDLSSDTRFAGIGEVANEIDNIIANNPRLFSDDMPLDEKIVTAYTIYKGINSINNPPKAPAQPTASELFEMYKNNAELQGLIEQSRIEELKQSQQVPNMAASSGAANAALTIKEKPKTLKDAGEAARRLFGLN